MLSPAPHVAAMLDESMPEGAPRKKSKLTQIGDAAKRAAMREALLQELERQSWNLTKTAVALDMAGSAAVVTALGELAPEEYAAARSNGRVAMGRPKTVL